VRHKNGQLTLSCHCPQDDEDGEETQEDRDFLVPDDANHSQGDDYLLDVADLYVPGKCNNILGYDPDEGDFLCGAACNPGEQMCHFCRTAAHRITEMF